MKDSIDDRGCLAPQDIGAVRDIIALKWECGSPDEEMRLDLCRKLGEHSQVGLRVPKVDVGGENDVNFVDLSCGHRGAEAQEQRRPDC